MCDVWEGATVGPSPRARACAAGRFQQHRQPLNGRCTATTYDAVLSDGMTLENDVSNLRRSHSRKGCARQQCATRSAAGQNLRSQSS
jgi:hypothetical protein